MTYRRLPGPILICLALAGLVADYLYLGSSPWSVLTFLSKIAAILGKIFGPALNPALYSWLDRFFVPAALIIVLSVSLWAIVARAKRAMRHATKSVDSVAPLSFDGAPELTHAAGRPSLRPIRPKKCSLAWKLVASFGALALVFTALVGSLTYTEIARALEKDLRERAGILALTLTGLASGTGRGSASELQRAIEKHGASSTIAYIYFEDAAGKIVAHVPSDLPMYLGMRRQKTVERDTARSDMGEIKTVFRGRPVLEVVEPTVSSTKGYIHLAIWHHAAVEQARRALVPMVAFMVVVVGAVSAAFGWVMWSCLSPVSELTVYADRLSHGELDLDLTMKGEPEEIRELANSFFRLRSSLYAVLTRLKDAPPNQSSRP